jgi:hypothetical protein
MIAISRGGFRPHGSASVHGASIPKAKSMKTSRLSTPLIVVAVLGAILAASFTPRLRVWAGERYTSGGPVQVSSWNVGERAAGYGRVVAIAHNAGDSPITTQRALASGASYVEIDVVYENGVLYAAHARPQGTVRDLAWALAPPVTLLQAWRYSAKAAGIELDIKETSPVALQQIVDFLDREWRGSPLMLASKDPSVLALMAEKVPGAFRLLSIDTPAALTAFEGGGGPAARPDGVTVRESLLNADSMKLFKAQGLVVLAWTVDDPARFDQLVDLGIDGVATNNLAITERLKKGSLVWSR